MIPWETIAIRECGEPLVDLEPYGILCKAAYFGMGLSAERTILVRRSVAEKLVKVEARLAGAGVRLEAWDGHRTRDVQRAIYDRFAAELKRSQPDWDDARLEVEVGRFVASPLHPHRILPHATGGAIDLTLVDGSGRELDMGTGFDDFSALAATDSTDVSADAQRHRRLLVEAMQEQGFANYPGEWWHFGFGDPLSAYLKGEAFAVYGETVASR